MCPFTYIHKNLMALNNDRGKHCGKNLTIDVKWLPGGCSQPIRLTNPKNCNKFLGASKIGSDFIEYTHSQIT